MIINSYFNIGLVISVITCISIFICTKFLISILWKFKSIVLDYHKSKKSFVAHPGGPSIIITILIAEIVLYYFTNELKIIAIILTTIIAGTIGLIDDLKNLGGYWKPILLLLSPIPIIFLDVYNPNLLFPVFGAVHMTIIYPVLILIAIPITSNTINTIDVLNGVSSGFTLVAAIPLVFALLLKGDWIMVLATIPLILTLTIFLHYHKYPSKIFPGDSGTLSIGAMYGAIAIIGGVEIIGVIALLPAILNSFFFLASVKRFTEHKLIKIRPTIVLPDGIITAEKDHRAPITLVRLIVAGNPSNEKTIIKYMMILAIFSSFLAIIVSLAMFGVAI
tara:strand:+ start:661 stop:1662 length:1002 start_codon:yes stop_codon:yes gene_type:complete